MFISLRFTLHREQIPGGIAPQQRSTGDRRRRFKVALIIRKHSSYKCASWKAILLVMEHFQKVVPQIWQLGKHICWMGKHTGRLHPKEVLGLIPEDATNPFCLCRGPLLFPCQHCVIVWLEVRILPISKWQVFDNFSLLSLLCPDVAKFRWEPIRASLACWHPISPNCR